MSNQYDTARFCLNGHLNNAFAGLSPDNNTPHCDQCGQRVIGECPKCKTSIRGDHQESLSLTFPTPAYCSRCGEPYPWTTATLAAASELISIEESLSPDERTALAKDLPDLISDTPRTKVAMARYRKLMQKAGAQFAGLMKDILVDIVSDVVAKGMGWK